MLDGTGGPSLSGEGSVSEGARSQFIAFTSDAEAESALRKGLADVLTGKLDVRRATLSEAITILGTIQTPESLLVDVSGESDPLGLLGQLAQVVEPDSRVLVIGDQDDRDFYRQVTRELGATEFLYKPLVPDSVARVLGTAITRRNRREF